MIRTSTLEKMPTPDQVFANKHFQYETGLDKRQI